MRKFHLFAFLVIAAATVAFAFLVTIAHTMFSIAFVISLFTLIFYVIAIPNKDND